MEEAFRIHEDIENFDQPQSAVIAGKQLHATKITEQPVRPTFAVLNNVPRTHALKNVVQPTKSTKVPLKSIGSINDENKVPGGKGNGDFVKQEVRTKPFTVYEDVPETVTVPEKTTINPGAIRQPLQEIPSDGLLETPMSISEILSPMSIDKSVIGLKNPLLVADDKSERDRFFFIEEYQQDILNYLKEAETKHLPKYNYIQKQPDISLSMRTILVDWLVEVGEEYKLHSETLCLSIAYIDRFLSAMSVVRAKLQLVGTAAMFIASKYEEIYPPDVNEFVYITDHTYTKAQVLRMEQLILKVLKFDLSVPTTFTFISCFSVMANIPTKVGHLANFISELSLLEAEPYLKYLPSQISSACIALSRYTLDYPIWSKQLEELTGYSVDSLKELIIRLNESHVASVSLAQQAIQEKFKSSKFLEVSLINPIILKADGFEQAIIQMQKGEEEATTVENNNENVRKMISSLIFV